MAHSVTVVRPQIINDSPYGRQQREPGLLDTLTSGIGAGIGQGITGGFEKMFQQQQQQKERSILDQALANVDPDDPNAVVQATRHSGVSPEIQESFLNDWGNLYKLKHSERQRQQDITRSRDIGNYFEKNPNSTPQQALSSGFTPDEINKYQMLTREKPNASLEDVRQKQFDARINNIIGKDEESSSAPHLREFAYRKMIEHRDAGLDAAKAMTETVDDVKKRKMGLEKLGKIADSPNLIFSNTFGSKIKTLRTNLQKLIKENAIEVEEVENVLKEKGWEGIELELLTSPVLTDNIIDYFLKENNGNAKKAKSNASEYGFIIENSKGK